MRVLVILLFFIGCSFNPPKPGTYSLDDRLVFFPKTPAFLDSVTIYWDNHAIPYIEASNELDVPYAMGLIHAHLRLSQLEIFRRAIFGEFAETASYPGFLIDEGIRTLNPTKAIDEIVESLPVHTAQWIERYVAGINHYKENLTLPSADLVAMNLENTRRWEIRDVIAITRLVSADVNWFSFITFLKNRNDPKFKEAWDRVLVWGDNAIPSFQSPIEQFSKAGSNSVVVRGGLIANDPHVGFALPNLWMVLGYKTPKNKVLGFMIPGLPVILLGRNDNIAWGGTNMIGVSTTLYDATGYEIKEREEEFKIRFWFDTKRKIKETELGPIISDVFDNEGAPVAVKWRGHEVSDEISSFIKVNNAKDFKEFKEAFSTYAVSGQNFLYTDVEGNIGQVVAIETNKEKAFAARLPVANPSELSWGKRYNALSLPSAFNPKEGHLVSANNTPVKLEPSLTISTNSNDRILQFKRLLEGKLDVESLSKIQLDTYAESYKKLSDRLMELLSDEHFNLKFELKNWDGRYEIDRSSAPNILIFHVAEAHLSKKYGEAGGAFLQRSRALPSILYEDSYEEGFKDLVNEVAQKALNDFQSNPTWGDIHKLKVQHWIGNVPVLGVGYVFDEFSIAGSDSTIFKTSASLTNEVHNARFGANSRHISDLRDPDENYFILMGGQDGFVGSAQYIDQLQLWREGKLIKVSLNPPKEPQATLRY